MTRDHEADDTKEWRADVAVEAHVESSGDWRPVAAPARMLLREEIRRADGRRLTRYRSSEAPNQRNSTENDRAPLRPDH